MGKTRSKEGKDESMVPYGAREKMPLWYSLAYASRGISVALNVILVGYVSFYASDVLGLNVATIGTLLLVSRVIEALCNLGVGYVIDRTRTPWGKARPYEVFIVLLWVFTAMLFSTPSMPEAGQCAYIFVLYVLINAICMSFLAGSDAVYLARTFTTDKNRITAMSINGVVVMLASIVFNIVSPQFIQSAGTDASRWSRLGIVMAVALAIIGILRFVFCKEVVVDDEPSAQGGDAPAQKAFFGEVASSLFKNKYLLILAVLMLITNIVNNIGPASTYYFKYIVGDLGSMSIANLTSLVAPLLLVVFPIASEKLGTTRILQACMAFGAVGLVIRTLGGTNMATILIGGAVSSLGSLPISMMLNAYLIDCMDYGEWKSGTRIEGMAASIVNFAGKVGAAAASGVIGLVMGIAGYDGSLAVQSASANAAIIGMFNIFPLVLYVVMFALSLLYNMDKVRPEMQAALKKKHGEA